MREIENTWVMITGSKTIQDATAASELGADAIGILVGQRHFDPYSDFVSAEVARSIRESLPTNCESVFVTHLINVRDILELARIIQPMTLQLHGESTPEDIVAIKKEMPDVKIIKAVHVIDSSCIETVGRYTDLVDRITLDTINTATDQIGGTGKTHDWNISKQIVQSYKIPVILEGGLNSDNIWIAINKVKPFGVDVSSGVKDSKGNQDNQKVALFIRRAKGKI